MGRVELEGALARLPEYVERAGTGSFAVAGSTEIGPSALSTEKARDEAVSGTRRPRAARPRPSSSLHRTSAPSKPTVLPTAAWRRPRILAAALAAVAVLAGVMALSYHRPGSVRYAAEDVRTKVGGRKTIVEWQSPSEYTGEVLWHEEGGTAGRTAKDSSGRVSHRAELVGLSPGKGYAYSIVFPDGKRSLDYSFRTPGAPIEPRDIEGAYGNLELVFGTPAPAMATLAAGGRSVKEADASSSHRMKLDQVELGRDPVELTFEDAAGDLVHLGPGEIRETFRDALLPAIIPQLTRELESFEIDQFLLNKVDQLLPPEICVGAMSTLAREGFSGVLQGEVSGGVPRYDHFEAVDARRVELSRIIRDHVEKQPYSKRLERLILLGRGLFDRCSLPTEQTLRLFVALREGCFGGVGDCYHERGGVRDARPDVEPGSQRKEVDRDGSRRDGLWSL